ncbi:hypothetical protein HUN08_09280 [Gordonia sp. X0973]|uniref:hypothetical protein n=1 Tax=Gordonia sp. X0973 TaxID=2742602 RepID=UPI000F524E2D|nr:hypothetical protein [Gordonia sp. X0973]QKT07362.1 hypothetical protein HUN08_09280 [Gordonia sp. X0973]
MSDARWSRNGRDRPLTTRLGSGKDKWVLAICLVFVLAGLAMAFSFFFANPAQCDNKPMGPDDRCSSTGSIFSRGYRERLVTPPPPLPYDLPIQRPAGRTIDEQRGTNRIQGYAALFCTGFFGFGGVALFLRARRDYRADPRDRDDADPPRDG